MQTFSPTVRIFPAHNTRSTRRTVGKMPWNSIHQTVVGSYLPVFGNFFPYAIADAVMPILCRFYRNVVAKKLQTAKFAGTFCFLPDVYRHQSEKISLFLFSIFRADARVPLCENQDRRGRKRKIGKNVGFFLTRER
ncbi:MAG: hypothetical protein ACRYHA_15495 [Janthinobacterium lividum]